MTDSELEAAAEEIHDRLSGTTAASVDELHDRLLELVSMGVSLDGARGIVIREYTDEDVSFDRTSDEHDLEAVAAELYVELGAPEDLPVEKLTTLLRKKVVEEDVSVSQAREAIMREFEQLVAARNRRQRRQNRE